MKSLFPLLLLATVSLSAAPATSLQVKAVLLEKLSGNQSKADGLYAVSNGSLRVGRHNVDLTPVVESQTTAQGKNLVGLRIEVSVDGVRRPGSTFGVIGISATPEEAVAVGLGEWYLCFAVPLFQAMQDKKSTLTVADYDAFAGALGLRGTSAVGWVDGSPAMNRKILDALATRVSNQPEFLALDLTVSVPPAGQPKSQCRMNGFNSASMAALLVGLDWPRSANGYIFKQAFVLKKRSPGQ